MSKVHSFLYGENISYIETLYSQYINDKTSVSKEWQSFFSHISSGDVESFVMDEFALNVDSINAETKLSLQFDKIDRFADNREKVDKIINAYRNRAHMLSNLDPLGIANVYSKKECGLDLGAFGLNNKDFIVSSSDIEHINGKSIGDAIEILESIYNGVEFDHIVSQPEKEWLYRKVESMYGYKINSEDSKHILNQLMRITDFEQYLHTKFPGAKRFSCEGSEAAILAVQEIVNIASINALKEVIIGMAHRGRLATLTNVCGKPYAAIISEFTGKSAFPEDLVISGDVKYHMGWNSIVRTRTQNDIEVTLLPNPSHLEAINPVLAGLVRAKQDYYGDVESVMGILVHGDAAFCGQGVVAESINLSQLMAYNTRGIMHVIVNNQIGYTATPEEGSPGRYSTEFAKIAHLPIIHVNADDINALLRAVLIAMEYKQKFNKDFVIDLVGYRKYGHNEGDEPSYTNGFMYSVIKSKTSVSDLYASSLKAIAVINDSVFLQMKKDFKNILDKEFELSSSYKPQNIYLRGLWSGYKPINQIEAQKSIESGVDKEKLRSIALKMCDIPSGFDAHPKILKLLADRKVDIQNNKPIDWALGESLAFGSLLLDGYKIRLTGQDVGRGTFSHRHSVLHSQTSDATYIPLNNIAKDQKNYFVANSSLSEYAVLGFEYGYSLHNPLDLVIWEAQFGDFANGAQILIDQFIASAEDKWMQMSGIVMLLPHGYEGQGPEHSSARIERFLQLAGNDNIQVANPSTPASFFHLIRRHMLSCCRRPLIVMTPKSLLRHRLAVSNIDELDKKTSFLNIKEDVVSDYSKITELLICTGKIYYELLDFKSKNSVDHINIIRFEQIYPFDSQLFSTIVKKYKNLQKVKWIQEEPENMGAWSFVEKHINAALNKVYVEYVGRKRSASPATGYLSVHQKEQVLLISSAFN